MLEGMPVTQWCGMCLSRPASWLEEFEGGIHLHFCDECHLRLVKNTVDPA